jgi:hypothetical protein
MRRKASAVVELLMTLLIFAALTWLSGCAVLAGAAAGGAAGYVAGHEAGEEEAEEEIEQHDDGDH